MPYLVGFYYNMANMHINKGAMSPKYSVHDHIRVDKLPIQQQTRHLVPDTEIRSCFIVMIAVHHVNKHKDSRDFDLQ